MGRRRSPSQSLTRWVDWLLDALFGRAVARHLLMVAVGVAVVLLVLLHPAVGFHPDLPRLDGDLRVSW